MSESAASAPGHPPEDLPTGPSRPVPWPLTCAFVGVLAEAGTMTLAGLLGLGEMVRGPASFPAVLALVVFALSVAAALAGGARALRAGRRRARGPVVTWQILQAATAVAVVGLPGRPGWVVAVAVVAAVLGAGVTVALVSPRAAEYLDRA